MSEKNDQQSGGMAPLEQIRARIDAIDERIQALIDERACIAREVGASKESSGALDYYRPEREAQVLRQVLARNRGPLRDDEVLRLFREIMSACLAQQAPLKVGFLGPEGTLTHTAVARYFGHSVRAMPLADVEEVFREVEAGTADFGVVPVESSVDGTVHHTLDMFLTSPLKICGEVELSLRHHLAGRMDALEGIARVCADARTLAQCRATLDELLPGIERVPVASDADGARRARDERGTAALASQTAVEVYGLSILAPECDDRPDDTTRFHVIGRKLLAPSGRDRTTIVMSGGDTESPGPSTGCWSRSCGTGSA